MVKRPELSDVQSFKLLLEGVLSGALSLETCEGVPAWPKRGGDAGKLAVIMHRAAPGAVALSGTVRGGRICCVLTLPRLLDACMRDRREWFDAAGPHGLLSSEIALYQALWSEADGVAVPLILIPGADAVPLLRDIDRELRRGLH